MSYEPAGVWPEEEFVLKGAWMKMMRFDVALSLADKGNYGLISACSGIGNGLGAMVSQAGY